MNLLKTKGWLAYKEAIKKRVAAARKQGYFTTLIVLLSLFLYSPLNCYARLKVVVTIKHPGSHQLPPPARETTSRVYLLTALDEVPDSAEWRTITKYPNRGLISWIYKHESNFGRNDKCRIYGKFNGFGWKEPHPELYGPTCFATFNDVVREVNDFIDENIKSGISYTVMGCWYVVGPTGNCRRAGYHFIAAE